MDLNLFFLENGHRNTCLFTHMFFFFKGIEWNSLWKPLCNLQNKFPWLERQHHEGPSDRSHVTLSLHVHMCVHECAYTHVWATFTLWTSQWIIPPHNFSGENSVLSKTTPWRWFSGLFYQWASFRGSWPVHQLFPLLWDAGWWGELTG